MLIFITNTCTKIELLIKKFKLVCILSIIFLLVGCSNTQKNEEVSPVEDEIALTIDNKSNEEDLALEGDWPKERGSLSETKSEKSYIYEGYNFDFGENLPKKNYIHMERDIKTDMCKVRLVFPADEKNNEKLDINFTYNPNKKEISELNLNEKEIDTESIVEQLNSIYIMVNS